MFFYILGSEGLQVRSRATITTEGECPGDEWQTRTCSGKYTSIIITIIIMIIITIIVIIIKLFSIYIVPIMIDNHL